MGKYSRLGKNTLLVFIGNAGAKLIGLLMLPFYTRWLSVEDYGTTDIITVYVTFLMYIVTCSLAEAIFVFPKGAEREKQKSYFSSGVAFLCFSFCCLLLQNGYLLAMALKIVSRKIPGWFMECL